MLQIERQEVGVFVCIEDENIWEKTIFSLSMTRLVTYTVSYYFITSECVLLRQQQPDEFPSSAIILLI